VEWVGLMSYIRWGSPLTRFTGESKSYVFGTCNNPELGKKSYEELHKNGNCKFCYTEDYDDSYENNPSFIELISRIVARQTDEKYAAKICRILAIKLGCANKLFNNGFKCSDEEWEKRYQEICKRFEEETKRYSKLKKNKVLK
jgi:hypothetical protein